MLFSILYCLIVLLLFCFLILRCCKKRGKDYCITRESSLQNLNNLRGLFAIEIVMGHIVRYENTILFPFGKFMICSVAFFFFVSAFGMAVSFEKKENYLGIRFILSKPLYLFILSIIIFIFGMIIDAICPNNLRYLDSGILHAFLLQTNWYIWEQIAFYFIFFLVYKFMPKYRVAFISILTVALSIVLYQKDFWEAYVASTFAFPAGLFCGEHFLQFKKFLYSRKGAIATTFLSIFGLSCLLVETESLMSIVFMRNAICLATIMIVFYGCNHFTVGNNLAARYLCKYSTEIYLSQFICIQLAESYQWNYMIRMPIVLLATLLIANVLHPIIAKLQTFLLTNHI